jgi:hypothetical protein
MGPHICWVVGGGPGKIHLSQRQFPSVPAQQESSGGEIFIIMAISASALFYLESNKQIDNYYRQAHKQKRLDRMVATPGRG